MLRQPSRILVAILAAGTLAACGGGGSSPQSAPTEEALKKAVATSSDAIFAGKWDDAYAYFTKECRENVSKSEFALLGQMGLSFIEGFADVKASDLRTGDVEIRNFSESDAEARADIREKDGDTFTEAADDGWTAWVYEDGGWRTSDCDDFQGEGMSVDDGEVDVFGYPPCSDLVDGELVPDQFGSGGELDITCEEGDVIQFGFSTTCFTSPREYASSDVGYVFLDEGIFRAGEVRGCAPPCTDLVDGEPVPSTFDDESTTGFNLNCELAAGGDDWSFEWECFESDRVYVENENGYAFTDDRIYVAGEPEYC